MVSTLGLLLVIGVGAAAIIWGAETFAEHLAAASGRLGITSFALALLLAGAEPEELATVITASARDVDGVAFGDVIGANAAILTIALGVGALIATIPFGTRIRRYALGGLIAGLLAAALIWDGDLNRLEGAVLVLAYVVFSQTWRHRGTQTCYSPPTRSSSSSPPCSAQPLWDRSGIDDGSAAAVPGPLLDQRTGPWAQGATSRWCHVWRGSGKTVPPSHIEGSPKRYRHAGVVGVANQPSDRTPVRVGGATLTQSTRAPWTTDLVAA